MKIAILSNGPGNYSTKRLREVAKARGPLVLEVNASPGFGIEKITGRDVATPIIEYIERNAKRRPRKDRVGA